MTENFVEKLSEEVAKQYAESADKGFVRGIKWISEFMILELEYQNLHEMAQKLKLFVARKEQEILHNEKQQIK